ncbi:hypothetical protein [Bosea beijingensis]|uniref:hypothetical protein n=1 Tax=Bosea beijingensis TaxID=3068632 RepID=UPI002741C68D|nr:hypothetical protein [Bosea sp. REN20]
MDRRSFLMTLVGGFAAAGMGGIAVAEAAQPKLAPLPDTEPNKGEEAVTAEMKEALDKTDAEFSQYYYYRRPRYYARPRYYVRPRYYYRPRYYARPRYYYRRRYY